MNTWLLAFAPVTEYIETRLPVAKPVIPSSLWTGFWDKLKLGLLNLKEKYLVNDKTKSLFNIEDGKITPLDVKKGDVVLIGKWSGTEIKIGSDDLVIIKESDIMGIMG